MFTDLNQALETIYVRGRDRDVKLVHFQRLLNDLGNPQHQLKTFHIGGTNGKGSTSNFINSVLTHAGYKVGLFTSPHLMVHNDRFRIGNTYIDDETLLELINRTVPYWDTYGISFFEIDVLIAIWYFIDQKVDYAIFEVGLGGRLDATNVLHPIATVITNISFDHMNVLGHTLKEIAREKAGIINEHGLVFTAEKNDGLQTIFKEKSKRQIYPIKEINDLQLNDGKISFIYRNCPIELSVGALYQAQNAALAFEVLYQLYHKDIITLKIDEIVEGLKLSNWPGRFEKVGHDPLLILDGAHNIDGMSKLVQTLEAYSQPKIAVFSALKDKDYQGMLERLEGHVDKVILTQFEHLNRAANLELLDENSTHEMYEDYKEALSQAIQQAKDMDGMVVVCGSLYFISHVRTYLLDETV